MRYCIIIFTLITFITTTSLLLNSCKKGDISFRTTPLPFIVPAHFPQPIYSFTSYPVSEEGFVLGRKLFYEGRLSKDGNFPCASCHQQRAAFTTYDHDLSHGYNNSHTLRNSPGIANLAWQPEYYQDGSFKRLDAVSVAHITAPDEMGETMEGVVAKLERDTVYKRLFRAAYGDEEVTDGRILNALSQFLINLVSYNTKYDAVLKEEAAFTAVEQAGYSLFGSKCATCHAEPLFTDYSYRNIGLPLNPFLKDYGRIRVTGNRADSLKFRVPSLRNVMLTGTYAHDGRMGNIRSMINHYRNGIQQSTTLDPALANGISLTDAEVDNLISFLRTLSDSSYTTTKRFSDQ